MQRPAITPPSTQGGEAGYYPFGCLDCSPDKLHLLFPDGCLTKPCALVHTPFLFRGPVFGRSPLHTLIVPYSTKSPRRQQGRKGLALPAQQTARFEGLAAHEPAPARPVIGRSTLAPLRAFPKADKVVPGSRGPFFLDFVPLYSFDERLIPQRQFLLTAKINITTLVHYLRFCLRFSLRVGPFCQTSTVTSPSTQEHPARHHTRA